MSEKRTGVRLPPIPDDSPEFTVEAVCFIPFSEPDQWGTVRGRLATYESEGSCTIDWHEHLFRIIPRVPEAPESGRNAEDES